MARESMERDCCPRGLRRSHNDIGIVAFAVRLYKTKTKSIAPKGRSYRFGGLLSCGLVFEGTAHEPIDPCR